MHKTAARLTQRAPGTSGLLAYYLLRAPWRLDINPGVDFLLYIHAAGVWFAEGSRARYPRDMAI